MSEPAPPPSPAGAVPTCYRHPGREAYIRCQRCGKVICPDCMRDSAVGFQCPDCVKEGARSTRSGRTAYGGLRPSNAGITSMVIIGLNVLVWLMVVSSRRPRQQAGRLARPDPVGQCGSIALARRLLPRCPERARAARSLSRGDGFVAPGRGRRRLLAADHQRVHPRRGLAHRLQHAGPVGARSPARAGDRAGAVHRAVPALGAGRLGAGLWAAPDDTARRSAPRGRCSG